MLNVTNAECQKDECHYAECHYVECHYAKCHGAFYFSFRKIGFNDCKTIVIKIFLQS